MSVITSSESNSQDYCSDISKTQGNQRHQTVTSMETSQSRDNYERIDNQLSSFEDLMDIIFDTPATTLSTYTQIDEPINISEKHQSQQFVSSCVCRRLIKST
jgi:hypothetical protein